MGRQESALDPGAGPVQRFAFELRKLRQEAGGITYRAMARGTGYSLTTLSRAAAGEQLPSLPVTLAYVAACGGDGEEWERRWRAADAETTAAAVAADESDPPYQGLARFEPGDRERFFGRERLAGEVLELVRARRFSAVFGPSGSGKSSLLRAGLIPALQTEPAPHLRPAAIRILTPGPRPARTHTALFTPKDGPGETVIVIDQFEEIFTLCTDPAERKAFIDLALTALQPDNRLQVVLAVRADFYGRCAEHDALAQALGATSLLVGPMNPAELRAAIVKPAMASGLIVEQALTARIVEEVTGEPGGLPLMSHALLETWRRRKGRALGEAAYEAAGGIHGAIARTAEDIYTQLTPAQADTARGILLRLITPGDGAQDTRRPITRTELDTDRPDDTAEVLERLVRARLVALNDDTVDLAHEALITAWPRLHTWIDTNRERLRTQRQLTEAATAWNDLDRDPGALYRGARLAAAAEAFPITDHRSGLTVWERAFLTASITAREQEQRSAARTARRLRTLLATLSVLVVLAMVAGLVAWQQNRSSARQRVEAEARRVAAVADSMRSTDPVRAMRLSLAAWGLSHTTETRSALLGAWAQKEQDTLTVPDAEHDADRYLTPDGRVLVIAGVDRVTKWDLVAHRRVWSRALNDLGGLVSGVSPDGRTLVVETGKGPELWDMETSRRVWAPSLHDVLSVDFGSSGRTLVTRSGFGDFTTVGLWDRRSHRLLFQSRVKSFAISPEVVTSPDDRLMALCPDGEPLQVWQVTSGRRLPVPAFIGRLRDACSGQVLQFSPQGARIAAVTDTGVRTWDFSAKKELPLLGEPGVSEIRFSRDGRFLAMMVAPGIQMWRVAAPDAPVFRYTVVNETIFDLRLDTDARVIRYVGGFRLGPPFVVRTLSLGHTTDPGWKNGPVATARFSPDGSTLGIVQEVGKSGRLRVLDVRTGRMTASLPTVPCLSDDNCYGSMAVSTTGRLFAYAPTGSAGDSRGRLTVTVWDARTRKRSTWSVPPSGRASDLAMTADGKYLLVSWDQASGTPGSVDIWTTGRRTRVRVLSGVGGYLAVSRDGLLATSDGHFARVPAGRTERAALGEDETSTLAFSDDGKHLAAADDSGRVELWDVAGRRHTGTLVGVFGSAPGAQGDGTESVSALAFSHDGNTLAVGGDQGTLQLWDVASNQRLGTPLLTRGDAIQSLSFGPGDSTLYVAGSNVALQKYPVASDLVAAAVCARAGGGLSQTDWKAYIPDQPYRRTC